MNWQHALAGQARNAVVGRVVVGRESRSIGARTVVSPRVVVQRIRALVVDQTDQAAEAVVAVIAGYGQLVVDVTIDRQHLAGRVVSEFSPFVGHGVSTRDAVLGDGSHAPGTVVKVIVDIIGHAVDCGGHARTISVFTFVRGGQDHGRPADARLGHARQSARGVVVVADGRGVVRFGNRSAGRIVLILDYIGSGTGRASGTQIGVGRIGKPSFGCHAMRGIVLVGADLAVAVDIAGQIAIGIVDV